LLLARKIKSRGNQDDVHPFGGVGEGQRVKDSRRLPKGMVKKSRKRGVSRGARRGNAISQHRSVGDRKWTVRANRRKERG